MGQAARALMSWAGVRCGACLAAPPISIALVVCCSIRAGLEKFQHLAEQRCRIHIFLKRMEEDHH